MLFGKSTLFSFLIIIITGVLICTTPPFDPDFGWHYKYGEFMVINKELPKENLYSYTLPDYEWSNSYWISELIMYVLFSKIGALPASAVFSLILSVTVYFTLLKNVGRRQAFLFGAFLFTLLGAFYISVRPFLFSTVFFFILLHTLKSKPEKVRYLPIMFLVWANTHVDFLLGLFVLGLFTLQNLYDNKSNWSKMFTIALPLALSTISTLFNPYGIRLWLTLLNEMNNVSFGTISEVSPIPLVGDSVDTFFQIMAVAAIAVLFSYLNFKNKKSLLWLFVSSVVFFVLSIKAIYFLRVVFILGAFSFVKFLESFKDQKQELVVIERLKKPLHILSTTVSVLLFLVVINTFLYNVENKEEKEEEKFPKDAVSYIKNTEMEGSMFNDYAWGGYLIMNLPEHKTFIDGRMASWKFPDGRYILKEYTDMNRFPGENEEKINRYFSEYNIGWALIRTDSELVKYLREEKGWNEKYTNDTATIIIAPNVN